MFPFGIVLFLLVVFPVAGGVEAPGIAWSKTYGGKYDEGALALVETSDGGFALAGYTTSSGAGVYDDLYDNWLVRTDAFGNMLWNRTYGGAHDQVAKALVETSDGGFAIAGSQGNHFWLVRTDAYGNMLWNRTYGSGCARAIVETSDGGFAMAGYTSPIYGGSSDVLLVRTSPESRPPTISIISPENRTYTANSVPLTFTVNKPAKWMAYSLDGKANVTIDGNTTLNGLPNGSHNITVYATDLEGNTAASKTVYFTVDAQGSFPTLLVAIASMISITGTAAGLLYHKKRSTSRKLQKNT